MGPRLGSRGRFHTLRKCCIDEWKMRFPMPTLEAWAGQSAEIASVHYTRVRPEEVADVTGVRIG